MISGLININKPGGVTSTAVVGKIKHVLHSRAVGHMGTLDPIGTGVLLMGVGKGTRLFDYYLNKDKVYETSFKFGSHYDTLDRTGTLLAETGVIPTEKEITEALPLITGEYDQMPPAYSAKCINGKKAYELARQGIQPELSPKRITVYSCNLTGRKSENEYSFLVHCSSGTYIRSLCRDLAEKLGSLAHMTEINRVRAGKFSLETAVSPDEFSEKDIIPLPVVLSDIPRVDIPDDFYVKLINGIKPELEMPGEFTVYCRNELFGIGRCIGGRVNLTTYLREGN